MSQGKFAGQGTIAHLPALTPLRGIAAMHVMIFHFTVYSFPNLDTMKFTLLIDRGYLAVDLFFLMSGFVIAHVYMGWFERGIRSPQFGKFVLARLARIYPLHIVILLVYVTVYLAGHGVMFAETGRFEPFTWHGQYSIEGLIRNVLMLQGMWNDGLSWNGPAWSISTEFFAYLLFPYFAVVSGGISGRRKAVFVTALLFTALTWFAYENGGLRVFDGPVFIRCLLEFLIGVQLYKLHRQQSLADVWNRDAVFVTVAVAIGLMMHFGSHDILIVGALMALILSAVQNKGLANRLLNSRALIWLGNISFSIYLIHAPLQHLLGIFSFIFTGSPVGGTFGVLYSLLIVIAMIALVLLLSDMTYRCIETPARRLVKGSFRPTAATNVAARAGAQGPAGS